MWRPDPGPCVAEVKEWGEHEDDIEYEKILRSLPKKILKRRELIVKNAKLAKVKDKQGPKTPFSLCVWRLSEFSRSSGPGEEAASMIAVYYESKDERKVMSAFSQAGIDLQAAEAAPVDPKSPLQHEQDMMYMPQCLYLEDTSIHEETPMLSREEIRQRLGA
eukprot:TRINITY_DN23092_c0_g2_i1.p1 TRINITY_DN23092_c0_g2~~TRINITY_DN23092_c0_g2_i1.p1  ORF type:complete len:162 (-),score=43.41 TRINITY_DN23092_c0_g2_i1:214-699(-)